MMYQSLFCYELAAAGFVLSDSHFKPSFNSCNNPYMSSNRGCESFFLLISEVFYLYLIFYIFDLGLDIPIVLRFCFDLELHSIKSMVSCHSELHSMTSTQTLWRIY